MYLYAILLGIVLGVIVSAAFNIHSKRGTDVYTHLIFGMTSTALIKDLLLMLVLFMIVVFGWLSFLVQDTTFVVEHPLEFMVESLLVSILPALTLFVVYYIRKIPLGKEGVLGFGVIALKCVVAHLLLQFSGVYSSLLK
jgi:hypothetical protein